MHYATLRRTVCKLSNADFVVILAMMFWLRLQPLFGLAIAGPRTSLHRYRYLPVLTALIVAAAYLFLIVTIDNTNLGTTNGLAKSPWVLSWGHGFNGFLDSGGYLYAPVYGLLARLIPDSLLQYGAPGAEITYRKMAVLNALFGGLASGLVFFLTLRFTASPVSAAIVSVMHAGAGFVLLNSINSEDIIPAYAFFLGGTVCFFEYLYRGGIRWCAASTALFALATLFHWTTMVPALAAIGAVYAVLLFQRRSFFRAGIAWLVLFLISVQVLVLFVFHRRHTAVWEVLYPEKADASGWVGFLGEKGWNLLVGMGNYFAGGYNLGDHKSAFANASILHLMELSWAVFAVALAAILVTLLARPISSGLPLLAVFAIALFVVGEIGAAYSQPQDPQMQVEPMFALILGMILLLSPGPRIRDGFWRPILAGTLALLGAANTAWNVHLMRAERGGDSRALTAVAELDRLFPRNTTVIVSQGFEGWVTWQYVLLWPTDLEGFRKQSVHLARAFTMNRGITGREAAEYTSRQIDSDFARGQRVVAADLWTGEDDGLPGTFTTVTSEEEARTYISLLRDRYRTGERWNTQLGPFVELLPTEARAAGGRP